MMMPMRTRITILIVAIPGLLDMTWILERFLALPVSLRNPSLLLLELPLLMVLLSVVMWSFAIRTLTYRGTVGLVVVSGFLLLSGLLRLGMIVAAPLDDPLLKPPLYKNQIGSGSYHIMPDGHPPSFFPNQSKRPAELSSQKPFP